MAAQTDAFVTKVDRAVIAVRGGLTGKVGLGDIARALKECSVGDLDIVSMLTRQPVARLKQIRELTL